MKSTSMGCGGCKPSHLKIASSHDCQGGQIGDEEVDQVVADDIFILIQHSAIILIKITLIIKLLNKKYWNGKISSRSSYSTDKNFLHPRDNLTRSPLYCNPEDRPAKVRSTPLLFHPSCNWQIFRTSIFISILIMIILTLLRWLWLWWRSRWRAERSGNRGPRYRTALPSPPA